MTFQISQISPQNLFLHMHTKLAPLKIIISMLMFSVEKLQLLDWTFRK